ncbi:hypothetical protein NHF46_10445 [Arthrobacter alpinus]|nr:hypothetical protein [Arthrobacter alpinus]
MSAEETAALEKAGKLPTAKFDAKGVPTITIPKNDAPAGLTVQVLTEGTGAVLAATDNISAFYTGWTWSDGRSLTRLMTAAKPLHSASSRLFPVGPKG